MSTELQNNSCVQQNSAILARDDLRAFLLVVRQALLMIVRFIENRYGLTTK